MRLERLEINGFKSFSDKSELAFDKGVTAIVGPNGCGKSNVADAITWVMGEQSAKSLRGDKMEDVIFNGSDARKPTAAAEVRLRFSGVLKSFSGPAFPDDPGLGAKAYSIIEQGKIGLILSSRPTDRRQLIEEAAGITKYKSRRRSAELKLEAAQLNLTRIDDIVFEVEAQRGTLKRQAVRARRYQRLRDEQ